MTVYVDDMRRRANLTGRPARWSHLIADTHDELMQAALDLGLRPEWIQHAGTHRDRPPHRGDPMTDQIRPARHELADLHAYIVPISPKMLRETLCVAQAGIGALVREHLNAGNPPRGAYNAHLARLEQLITECDQMRPLGPDGKHGDRHTAVCGCDDKPAVTS